MKPGQAVCLLEKHLRCLGSCQWRGTESYVSGACMHPGRQRRHRAQHRVLHVSSALTRAQASCQAALRVDYKPLKLSTRKPSVANQELLACLFSRRGREPDNMVFAKDSCCRHPVWWGQAALPDEVDRPTYEAGSEGFRAECELQSACTFPRPYVVRTLGIIIRHSGQQSLARSRC